MISKLRKDSFDFICPDCGQTDTISMGALVAGIARDNGVTDQNAIALPPCSFCQSRTFLARHLDAAPDDFRRLAPGAYKKRQAVNAIHAALVEATQMEPACAAALIAESTPAADIMAMPAVEDDINPPPAGWKPNLPPGRWSPNRPGAGE